MTKELNYNLLNRIGSMFVSEDLPEDWLELDETSKIDFIENNMWGSFKEISAFEISNAISEGYNEIKELLESEG